MGNFVTYAEQTLETFDERAFFVGRQPHSLVALVFSLSR